MSDTELAEEEGEREAGIQDEVNDQLRTQQQCKEAFTQFENYYLYWTDTHLLPVWRRLSAVTPDWTWSPMERQFQAYLEARSRKRCKKEKELWGVDFDRPFNSIKDRLHEYDSPVFRPYSSMAILPGNATNNRSESIHDV